uniref:Uncharacterized protein n=1 Tax=Romanomermis culicivorax TaxID=13658 RepID=A0A915JDQ4_ROMCU
MGEKRRLMQRFDKVEGDEPNRLQKRANCEPSNTNSSKRNDDDGKTVVLKLLCDIRFSSIGRQVRTDAKFGWTPSWDRTEYSINDM